MRFSLNTLTGKTLASLALVGTAAGVAGLGTYGAFSPPRLRTRLLPREPSALHWGPPQLITD